MVGAGAGRRVFGFGWLAPALRAASVGRIAGFSEGFLLRIILYFDVFVLFGCTAPAKSVSGRQVTDSSKNGKFLPRGWDAGEKRRNGLRPTLCSAGTLGRPGSQPPSGRRWTAHRSVRYRQTLDSVSQAKFSPGLYSLRTRLRSRARRPE